MPSSPEAARERWGALPLGELHPDSHCALCGVPAMYGRYAEGQEPVRRTQLVTTRAWALICVDVIACERRRYNQRRKI